MYPPQRRNPWLAPLVGILLSVVLAVAGYSLAPLLSPALKPASPTSRPTTNPTDPGSERLFPTVGNDGYDVSHYGIDLRYRADGSITATTTITGTATAPLTEITFDFQGLDVSEVQVNGTASPWNRHGDKLQITPAASILDQFQIVVSYAGKPSNRHEASGMDDGWLPTSDGATVLAEPLGAMTWFPNNNIPTDKATFDITVTVPKGLTVAGSGDLVTHRTTGQESVWVWRQSNPISTYLAMISIGHYQMVTSSFTSIDGRRLKLWSFVDPKADFSDSALTRLPRIITDLEKAFGPYPQTSCGLVLDKMDVNYSLETNNRPVITFAGGDWLIYHELAHQWFGDSLSVSDWSQIWLNEGFATYSQFIVPADRATGPTGDELYSTLLEHAQTSSEFWTPAPMPITDPEYLFSQPVVYYRPALALWALRKRVGAQAFTTIMTTWSAEHRDGSVNTDQFIALAERISGTDLDAFFTAWLFTAEPVAEQYR